MAVVYYVIKEGIYSATCLEDDIKPLNPPDNCDLTIINNGKVYRSLGGQWIPATPIILQNNRWVDIIGSDTFGIGDGSIVNPYRTIQKAIDSITGASTSNPYIINIGLGTFVENITVKNGLSLIGLCKNCLDSNMNLTIISGNVISNTISGSSDCNFAGIEFKGSGNTIIISGSSSANTNSSHFSNCRILSTFSATNYSNIVFNDVSINHPTINTSFRNNSNFTFYKGLVLRGIDIDSGSTLNLYGTTEFNRNVSNILGSEIQKTLSSNLYYDNTSSELSATNPQDAIDELVTMINLSGGSIPIHNTENTTYNITYTGFGTTGATSIMKVISYSANTYDVLWAEGNKIQNKNWDDRFTYSYSAIT